MALPNPGMDAVPFTPLTAEFLDDMIENIEFTYSGLSTGSGIGSGTITNAKLSTTAGEPGAAWQSYTPTWTASSVNPTLGNGTLTGAYNKVGKMITARIFLQYGSTTSSGTGAFRWSLPVTPKSSTFFMGSGWGLRTGSAFEAWPVSNIDTFGAVQAYIQLVNTGGGVSSSTQSWTNGDKFVLEITYESV